MSATNREFREMKVGVGRRGSSKKILSSIFGRDEEEPGPAEGFDYKPDMQVPLFSTPDVTSQSRSRGSLSSQADDDAMATIVSDSQLWREFQSRLKETGNITGSRASTKEVLREFMKEKGLDRAEDDEASSASAANVSSLLRPFNNSSVSSFHCSNETLAERFKERPGSGPRQVSTTAAMLLAARRRSSQLSMRSFNQSDGSSDSNNRESFFSSHGSRKRSSNLSFSSSRDEDFPEEALKATRGSTLELAKGMMATLDDEETYEGSDSFCSNSTQSLTEKI